MPTNILSFETERVIIDIGTALVADQPERFDILVMPNLYGDIVSDVTAQIAGSVGLAGSANIGIGGAMFEAIHGSAPDIAGKDIANPSALINAAVMLLLHIGQPQVAQNIHNALLKTIEDGIHTKDIYDEKISKQSVGTQAFAQAVMSSLGQSPSKLKRADYSQATAPMQLPQVKPHLPRKKH